MSDLNRMIWSGRPRQNHYEGWYLTLIDPKSGCGFWFRYTLLVPKDSRPPSASVWAFAFDPTNPENNVSGRAFGPITALKEKPKPWTIQIGEGNSLSEKKAQGQITTSAGPLSWDLSFGDSNSAWEHFNPKLFQVGVSSTCVNSPRLSVPISGTIILGGKQWTLTNAPGEQSHIWGRQPTAYYTWAHCNSFDNNEDGLFEGINARIQKGPLQLPGAGPLLFQTKDARFEVKGLIPMFQVDSEQDFGEWSFEAERGRQLLCGRVWVAPEHVVAVEYDDPLTGGTVVCHNSIVANMELTLYKRGAARWEARQRRRSTGRVAFEITRRDFDPRVGHRLLLKDGRALKS